MRESDAETKPQRVTISVPFFYGWVVVGLCFLAVLTAAGIRAAPSVLIHPLEAEFGWSRTAIASAASVNLLLYGLAAPAGGWLMDRFGPRVVILGSLTAIAAGVTGTVFIQELWQLVFLWGIVLGLATGVTPSLGPSVATRWFVGRRGLAIGIMTNANATGQVIFVPLIMALIVSSGWRSGLMLMAAACVVLLPAVLLWMRDNPADVGLDPYGSTSVEVPTKNAYATRDLSARAAALTEGSRSGFRPAGVVERDTGAPAGLHFQPALSIAEVFRTSNFWLLSACFFVCGVTSNGLIGTHLIPHSIERGFPQVTAAVALGIMGGASFVGTTFAGWLVDRVDPRKVLAAAYMFRGSSLFILPYVSESWGLFVFAVLFGLDWFASGPPTTTLIAHSYGHERVGSLFGLVFVFHQLGGALAAFAGGWARTHFGDYQYAFLAGGLLGLMAAGLALTIRMNGMNGRPRQALRTGAEFASA